MNDCIYWYCFLWSFYMLFLRSEFEVKTFEAQPEGFANYGNVSLSLSSWVILVVLVVLVVVVVFVGAVVVAVAMVVMIVVVLYHSGYRRRHNLTLPLRVSC